jgi:hypothetical protein
MTTMPLYTPGLTVGDVFMLKDPPRHAFWTLVHIGPMMGLFSHPDGSRHPVFLDTIADRYIKAWVGPDGHEYPDGRPVVGQHLSHPDSGADQIQHIYTLANYPPRALLQSSGRLVDADELQREFVYVTDQPWVGRLKACLRGEDVEDTHRDPTSTKCPHCSEGFYQLLFSGPRPCEHCNPQGQAR